MLKKQPAKKPRKPRTFGLRACAQAFIDEWLKFEASDDDIYPGESVADAIADLHSALVRLKPKAK